ncbi:MAG: protein-L-isoaspartate(D-aspartate) O-methyltransferase [bacterium]|nr:protein-L-isoaspartate(D-aspartate) O-methyltransferase [bacterium]MCP5065829.1 protein-L-isoaspartate(D-aspartate) O-methyltransferase [bacterium]
MGTTSVNSEPEDFGRRREAMVREQIEARGIRNPRVLAALRKVPRHRFVPEDLAEQAYRDGPLPIGQAQTISQPFIVASMTELVDPQPGDTVLEIGTGSGYQAAVLAELVTKVLTIEIVPVLATRSRALLAELGYGNVEVVTGDGWKGLPEAAPFDGIVVTAAPAEIPPALLEQLAVGAKLVIPVGRRKQMLRVVERTEEGFSERGEYPVRFVPLTRKPESDPER